MGLPVSKRQIQPLLTGILCLPLLIIFLGWYYHAGASDAPLIRSEFLMGSVTTITAFGPEMFTEKGMDEAFAALHAVDGLASFQRPDSELSRLNKERRLTPTASFAALLQAASEAVPVSQGGFDPTFAVLHQAYGFYSGKGRQPGESEIAECLTRIGWQRSVAESSGTILLASGTLVDLSGIAGGLAVEAAANALRQASCFAFLIDNGGDLWVEGKKPDGNPWRVGVKDPRRENGIMAVVETFQPAAISTSGDYERFVTVSGRKIGHLFDPRNGRPAEFYRSVTVIASQPIQAEVRTKTLFCLPPDKARAYADQYGIPALFLSASGSVWMSESGKSWFREVVP